MTAFKRFDLSLIPEKDACASCANCASSASCAECATCATGPSGSQDGEKAIAQWLNAHPLSSPPGRCAHCGRPEESGAMVVPFGAEGYGHTWLHPKCWDAWFSDQRANAMRALGHRRNDNSMPKL